MEFQIKINSNLDSLVFCKNRDRIKRINEWTEIGPRFDTRYPLTKSNRAFFNIDVLIF